MMAESGISIRKAEEQIRIALNPTDYILPVIKDAPKKFFRCGSVKVNLYYLTCSCKQYREKVPLYPKRGLNRVCRHLYFKLYEVLKNSMDDLSLLMLETHFWDGAQRLYTFNEEGILSYAGFISSKNLYVIYTNYGRWEKFLFDANTEKWKNERAPLNIMLVENIITSFKSGI